MEGTTEILLNSSSVCPPLRGVIYWALNCYGVTAASLVTGVVTIIVGILIMFLNAVALYAVLQKRDLENVTDILIGSLAISDTIVGVFLIYQCTYNLVNWQVFEECIIRYGILLGVDLTSVFHLALLTVDRYVKITRPYLYQRIFKKTLILGLSMLFWILAFVTGFSPLFRLENRPSPTQELQCAFFLVVGPSLEIILVVFFLLPLGMNIVMYAHIFTIAKRHSKAIADMQATQPRRRAPSTSTWKFTKTVCILLGFYFTCWMPLGVFILLDYSGHLWYYDISQKGIIVTYLSVLAYINSMVNPIIYAVKIPYIKQQFARVFGWLPCCQALKRKASRPQKQDSVTLVEDLQVTDL